ncbi:MAG TPA: hypothetical protein DCX53_11190 [Anaerolineae bacterium]|nr:hypothetical protein [Anaerolineae bacterium]
MKFKRTFITLTILALMALACGGFGTAPEPADAPPPPVEEGTSSETGDPSSNAPDAVLNLDDAALYDLPEDVNSYLTTLEYRFEAPGPVTGAVRMESATQVEPYETTLEFKTEGRAVLGGGELFTFTQVAGTQYAVYTGFDCVVGAPGSQENPFAVMLDIGGMLKGEAQLIGEETVNNMEAYAYAITQDNIDVNDPAGAGVETINESRIYIARDGGHVLRLMIDGTGRVSVLSGDSSLLGDVYYELNYFDFGVPVDVQIPSECPLGGAVDVDYPLPADATDITNVSGVVAFDTGMTTDILINFYKAEMPALGCSAPQETITPQLTTLTFECTSGTVTMILTPNESGGIAVTIFKP